jgi:hypothetical protein
VPPSCNCQSTDPNECDDIQLNFNGTIYEQPNIYNQGCLDSTVLFSTDTNIIIGVIAVVFVLIEAVGIIFACGLIYCISRGKDREAV